MPTILSTALLASSDQAATTINTVVRGGNAGHCTSLAVDGVSPAYSDRISRPDSSPLSDGPEDVARYDLPVTGRIVSPYFSVAM